MQLKQCEESGAGDVVREVARAFYAVVRFLAASLNEVGAFRGSKQKRDRI